MTTKDEALKLALEALNELIPDVHDWYGAKVHRANAAITDIREALAEQPVQQQDLPDFIAGALGVSRGTAYDMMREALAEQDGLDLQDKDPELVEQHYKQVVDGVREVFDAKRKQPAQQEPVAWVCEGSSSDEKHAIDYWPGDVDDLPIGTKLYTSPPASKPWVGLTYEEGVDILNSNVRDGGKIVRAIEAKLREKNA